MAQDPPPAEGHKEQSKTQARHASRQDARPLKPPAPDAQVGGEDRATPSAAGVKDMKSLNGMTGIPAGRRGWRSSMSWLVFELLDGLLGNRSLIRVWLSAASRLCSRRSGGGGGVRPAPGPGCPAARRRRCRSRWPPERRPAAAAASCACVVPAWRS